MKTSSLNFHSRAMVNLVQLQIDKLGAEPRIFPKIREKENKTA